MEYKIVMGLASNFEKRCRILEREGYTPRFETFQVDEEYCYYMLFVK